MKKLFLFFCKKGLTNEPKSSIICEYEKIVRPAALAQLDRVFGYEPKGQGFESLTPRQNMGIMLAWFPYFVSVFAREIPRELPPAAISPRTRANAYLKPLT